jgi:hypothetical protein
MANVDERTLLYFEGQSVRDLYGKRHATVSENGRLFVFASEYS